MSRNNSTLAMRTAASAALTVHTHTFIACSQTCTRQSKLPHACQYLAFVQASFPLAGLPQFTFLSSHLKSRLLIVVGFPPMLFRVRMENRIRAPQPPPLAMPVRPESIIVAKLDATHTKRPHCDSDPTLPSTRDVACAQPAPQPLQDLGRDPWS